MFTNLLTMPSSNKILYLRDVVSSFLDYSVKPCQHKERLRPGGGIPSANELWTPRVVRTLEIFLNPWRCLEKETLSIRNVHVVVIDINA